MPSDKCHHDPYFQSLFNQHPWELLKLFSFEWQTWNQIQPFLSGVKKNNLPHGRVPHSLAFSLFEMLVSNLENMTKTANTGNSPWSFARSVIYKICYFGWWELATVLQLWRPLIGMLACNSPYYYPGCWETCDRGKLK